MTATSWLLLLFLASCQQVCDGHAPMMKRCEGNYICCSHGEQQLNFDPSTSQTERMDTSLCERQPMNNASGACSEICNSDGKGSAGYQQYTHHNCWKIVDLQRKTEDCKCTLLCGNNSFAMCEKCKPNDRRHIPDNSWDKATLGIVIGVVVVGVAVVLTVTFRKKIKRSRRDKNNQSQRNTKRNIGRLDEEGVSGRSRYTSPSDLDSSTEMYSLQSGHIEVGRNYRPLRQSMKKTTAQHFQLQPSIHRPFEDDNENEIYNEINDEDIKCFPVNQLSHNAISPQTCDVTPYFLERECDQEGSDEGYYKKLDRQSARDRPTDCVSTAERNYRRLYCPTQLSGGYELARAITDSQVNTKIDEEPSSDNALSDNTTNISYDHNPYDNVLSDNSSQNTISENPEGNAFSAPHDIIFSEKHPHDKSLPDNDPSGNPSYDNSLHDNIKNNCTSDDKTPHEQTHLDHAAHDNCP